MAEAPHPALNEIVLFVEQRVGIKPRSVGDSSWLRAIRRRMEATHTEDMAAYVKRLKSTKSECQALIELVVVPETWFFRDRAALDHLGVYVKTRNDEGRTKPWRILSMACASGEEAFSIAMSLYDIGVPLQRFVIEGVDVSKKALEIAATASYGSNSFRNKVTLMHKRNFDRVGDSYVVHKNIRNRVTFSWANVINPQFYIGRGKYDVIFCRNLLIYFGSAVQKQVLTICDNLMEEDGLLVLGPTESEAARLAGFVPLGPRSAFTFQKMDKRQRPANKSWREEANIQKIHQAVSAAREKVPQELGISTTRVADRRSEWLNKAMHLADEGHIADSISLCNQYIERFEVNSDIYYLLGTLHLASRSDELAATFFQKAVYLSPTHYGSLVNLALLAERRGDNAQAELFWRRARKNHMTVEQTIESDSNAGSSLIHEQ